MATASPAFESYARLRRSTSTVSLSSLHEQRPPPSPDIGLQHDRAWRMAVALTRFNFHYGDLIRWLDGEYTNSHRDWSTVTDTIEAVRDIEPPPGYPRLDYERAFRVCTEGVPLAGDYECSFESVRERNLYDNHPGLYENEAPIRAQFAKEEANSFHLALPRFLWRFIVGLHLAPLVWAIRKMKGRLCVDPSSRISDDDDGAANDSIPAPGTDEREDECPAIWYATALYRHLVRVWRLRISHPAEDILQFVDDIHAAFRRVLYHPDGGIIFASVFAEFLIIPVGTIFGARNSPSYFCMLSELRAHAASVNCYRPDNELESLSPLAQRVRLIAPPSPEERDSITQAVADGCHSGIQPDQSNRYHNSTFVDDNGIAELASKMLGAIDNSIRSAYAVFGPPGTDRRQSCLSEEKWNELASYTMTYLGFQIDTRAMVMRWPVEKRRQLQQLLDSVLTARPCRVHPRQISSILGLIRNAASVAPLGIYLSLRLQHSLNDAMQQQGARPQRRRWWRSAWVTIPPEAILDLIMLRGTLDENPAHYVWNRPIGLLVPRSPTGEAYSDASYQGIGGWSPTYKFMWRLTRQDLIDMGFDMKTIDASGEPAAITEDCGEHINVLEFVAIIVNFWVVLKCLQRLGPITGGHIVSLLSDNTSALSWMRYAARSHRPVVRELARLFMSLTLACADIPFKVSGRHIAGVLNTIADTLSRFNSPEEHKWAYVIGKHSQLATCQAYRLPRALLSTIATVISSAKTGVPFEPQTTALLTAELCTLRTGSANSASTTSLSGRRRPRRRSR